MSKAKTNVYYLKENEEKNAEDSEIQKKMERERRELIKIEI